MDVMELADLHHPDCHMSRQNSEQHGHCCDHRLHHSAGATGVTSSSNEDLNLAGASSSSLPEPPEMLILTPEAYKATEAVEFIAEHLRNEDEYTQVRFSSFKFHFVVATHVMIASLLIRSFLT